MQFALLVHAELEPGCVAELCSDFHLPLIMKIHIQEHGCLLVVTLLAADKIFFVWCFLTSEHQLESSHSRYKETVIFASPN